MSIGYFRQWNSLGPLLPDLRGTTTPARSPPSKAHWPRSRWADPDWSNPGRKLDENTCNWSGALVGSVLANGRLPHPHARRSNRVQLPRDAACPCHSAARKLHERPSHVACACGAPLCRRRAGGLQAAAQSYASVCPRPAVLACRQRRRPFRPAASLEYRGGDSRLDRRCWADWCGGGVGCLARGPTRRHLRISWNTPLPAANTLCRTVRLLAPFSPSPFVPAWLARCAR